LVVVGNTPDTCSIGIGMAEAMLNTYTCVFVFFGAAVFAAVRVVGATTFLYAESAHAETQNVRLNTTVTVLRIAPHRRGDLLDVFITQVCASNLRKTRRIHFYETGCRRGR
jgi:hypothetical protein